MSSSCPECKADLPDESVEACPFCGKAVPLPKGDHLVPLIQAESLAHANLIKSLLDGGRIPSWIRNADSHAMWGGLAILEGGIIVLVPKSAEEQARKVLCARGVVCEATTEEVNAMLEDHVSPALQAGREGATRLVPILAANNKEIVVRVVRALQRKGEEGLLFLGSLLEESVSQGDDWLSARLAESIDGLDASELSDLPVRLIGKTSDDRLVLAISAIARMRRLRKEAVRSLVPLLQHHDMSVRAEAIEGLFSLEGFDLDYEPDAPDQERMQAVERWQSHIQ